MGCTHGRSTVVCVHAWSARGEFGHVPPVAMTYIFVAPSYFVFVVSVFFLSVEEQHDREGREDGTG